MIRSIHRPFTSHVAQFRPAMFSPRAHITESTSEIALFSGLFAHSRFHDVSTFGDKKAHWTMSPFCGDDCPQRIIPKYHQPRRANTRAV
jgi:hypothetical protein